MAERARAITNLRKRRGVAKGSITRLSRNLKDLEGKAGEPNTINLAQQMSERLKDLDADFKKHHSDLIDLIDDEEDLLQEQDALDEHDEEVCLLRVSVEQLIAACAVAPDPNIRRIALRRITHLQRSLTPVSAAINDLADGCDLCLLRQYKEQLSDFKKEARNASSSLLSLDLEENDELMIAMSRLDKGIFDCCLVIKKLLQSHARDPAVTPDGKGVRLPKLDVPIFDGNILQWRSFWEQFCVSVHDRPSLSDSEKLVYLQQSLKGGSAKHVIEGLSRSGEHYTEAIECLKVRYDRPRLIHQTHVRMILEAPSLKDGSGKELRRLHDTVQQHLRALKAMDYEPSGPFVTSILELKLDTNTKFEWQKHSQAKTDVPHYQELLEFISLRAQASETSLSDNARKPFKNEVKKNPKLYTSFTANTTDPDSSSGPCTVCKTEKHQLYFCDKFKSLSHDEKLSILRGNRICMNCLRPGHFIKECKSHHKCRKCQKPHHTLLHVDKVEVQQNSAPAGNPIASHATMGLVSNSLLMTCCIFVYAPDGSSVPARALLDSASSASFLSERLAQSLLLPRHKQNARISGVAGLTGRSNTQSVATFDISAASPGKKKFTVAAVVVPKVTCDLPLHPISLDPQWSHLSGLHLADPKFSHPGRIDLLLGVDVFVEVLRSGRRAGAPGSPTAIETEFGWVLAGNSTPTLGQITTHHTSLLSGDDLLRRFWEIEEHQAESTLPPEDQSVVLHFKQNHLRSENGRFIVPLPKRDNLPQLGESRSQAVRRFFSLERSLHSRNQFEEVNSVINDYFQQGHAEPVPIADLEKPTSKTFYLPIQVVRKDASTTTKVRAVFDASAKTSSGVSLNDTLLVGPTVHPPLRDVLLRFRTHRVALVTDVSRMYRAVELVEADKDLHRFVWRTDTGQPLRDYRMTRVTFGVSASSFIANMSVKQNALDLASEYPLAAAVVDDSFYVDDGLTGADSVNEAIKLRNELQNLFSRGCFLLRKWNSSEPAVLEHIPPELKDSESVLPIPGTEEYTKTLGVAWCPSQDHFRLTVATSPPLENLTKRKLVSDVAKTFDVLGWFSPAIIKVKILLQQLWELKVAWDDAVPSSVRDAWQQWRSELHLLSSVRIPRCYFPKDVYIVSSQLHGFSDASEHAYSGVVYVRTVDTLGNTHISLVTSKTKVAPIKKLTIPRLELCGAQLLARLLSHVQEVFKMQCDDVYAWTDSTIVLCWLTGNPKRFKTYVGNRITSIIEHVAPSQWNHVSGTDNPADCASRGLFPSELVEHQLWWNGPEWLHLEPSAWPKQSFVRRAEPTDEEKAICLLATVEPKPPLVPLNRYSSFDRLKRVTAWVMRFSKNCRAVKQGQDKNLSHLTVQELFAAEMYWAKIVQEDHFACEIENLSNNCRLQKSSPLLSLHPFLDSSGLLRVGGRECNSNRPYCSQHPIILQGTHPITKLIVHSEHLRLLHAGPTLLYSSVGRRFHLVGGRRIVRSIARTCVTCRRRAAKPQPQLHGQLPMERVSPGSIFDKVGVDYAGPVNVKYGSPRRPTIVKTYICVFVSLTIKAVHLELVSDLTTEAFLGSLRRFIARRGKPSLIWSDHGSNFVGAAREIKELFEFLRRQSTQGTISQFCSTQNVTWEFIPERAPHFGGLWEAAVKSLKFHLCRVTSDVKLTFEELTTVLTQIEACLNSRPLVPMPCDDDGIEVLTPGHFLIGKPLEALPDPSFSYRSPSLLQRWHLCQSIVRHFWQRWSNEYLTSLRRISKWHHPTRNLRVGDIVVIQENTLATTKWPLAKVVEVHPGKDGLTRVVTVKTSTGTYRRPIVKIALILPCENCVNQ